MADKNDETDTETMQKKLQEIKDQDGIIGYILRDSKSASIDLKDPKKIIDYAVLSSTSFDVANSLAETLQIGEVDKVIVESEEAKIMAMNTKNHRLSIFMEKSVDHDRLYKSLK